MSDNEVLISIIIPYYNEAEYLKKLLESISISGKQEEVIVINDKSSRNTAIYEGIKKQYINQKVFFVNNETNKKGAGTCRNIGLQYARGKWIVFADSDDKFTDDYYTILMKYADASEDIIFFNETSIIEGVDYVGKRHIHYSERVEKYKNNPNHKNENMLRYLWDSPCGKMIRRSLVEETGILFDEVAVSNDVMFSVKTGYEAKSVTASDEVIYIITDREKSLIKQYDYKSLRIREKVLISKSKFLKRHLSKVEYESLNINAYNNILFLICKGYPLYQVLLSIMDYFLNGVKIIDPKRFNIRTAPKTFIKERIRAKKH